MMNMLGSCSNIGISSESKIAIWKVLCVKMLCCDAKSSFPIKYFISFNLCEDLNGPRHRR
jgi:hypothetical protein